MTTTPAVAVPFGAAEVEQFLTTGVRTDSPQPGASAFPEVLEDLAALSLPPGAPVLIVLPNGIDLLSVFFAVSLLGGVPVPMASSATAARTREVAVALGAAAVVAPSLRAGPLGGSGRYRVGRLDAVALPSARPADYSPGEVVIPTSGTSGIFSACVHTVDALLRNSRRHAAAIGQRPDDTILVTLPMNYSYALVAQALSAFATGCRLVVSGPPFTAPAYRAAVRSHGITVSSLTPVLVRMLARQELSLPSSLRVLTVGGDALEPALVARVLAENPGLELYLTYGLTEAGPRVSTLAAHREPAGRHSSVGLPLPGVRAFLRNPDRTGCGELLVASDTVLRRKVGRNDGDAADPLVSPGVLATGDRFVIDEDGYLYFRGRLRDFLVVDGQKVALPSIRRFAGSLPGVLKAVTKVHRADGDRVRFDLELYVDEVADTRAIERRLREVLLRNERPAAVVFHAELPSGVHK
ncbi:class I adenylate-forming enzyme family protein [Amycolatopsis sp. NPDC051716]|uniref:class I adenylate-forming enzyme family protein n=1 Tax=Amycolatopsis sp. NPDC051716 TaxID=3155804 RepID=UPI00343D2E98